MYVFLKVEEKYSKIVIGMGDHSRLALCAFMVGLLAFNPFSSFLGGFLSETVSNDYSARVDQRRILSDDSYSKSIDFIFFVLTLFMYTTIFWKCIV